MVKATLLDIAKRTGNDAVVGLVDQTIQMNAMLNVLPFRPITGISYKFARRKSLPTVGFRGYNQGITASKSIVDQVTIETKNIGGRSEVDKLLAEADPRGINAYRAEEDSGFAAAMGNVYNSKAYYGKSSTTKGLEFDGVSTLLNDLSMETVIDGGGSTSGQMSSVYAVATVDAVGTYGRMRGVEGILGNGKNITAIDMDLQYVKDGDNKDYLAYVTEFEFAPGLAIYDMRSIGRIANLGTSNTVTIKMLNDLKLAMMPFTPAAFFVTKKIYSQLLDLKVTSFQVMNEDRDIFKWVLTFDGTPIFVDENLVDTEDPVA